MGERATDLIEITGLRLRCRIGVTPDERVVEQDVEISLAARLDTREAARTDDIAATMDYEETVRRVSKIVTGESFGLVERLADRIARAVLSHPRVADVLVRVSKPNASLPEAVEGVAVEVHRSRDEFGYGDLDVP